MRKHEKLKKIFDTIGYIPEDYWFQIELHWIWGPDICKTANWYQWTWNWDVREIIYTTEFMQKYINFCIDNYAWLDMVVESKEEIKMYVYVWLMSNLDDPVDYLYTLLGLWDK